MMNIDLMLKSGAWDKEEIYHLAAQILQTLPPSLFASYVMQDIELSLVLMDDADIQALNLSYRGKDAPTNVLSFPTDHAQGLLGDIVLAYSLIKQQACDRSIIFKDHVSHLIIHGVLHLLGYDHQTDKQAKIMEAIEIEALAKLGIANPYILRDNMKLRD